LIYIFEIINNKFFQIYLMGRKGRAGKGRKGKELGGEGGVSSSSSNCCT
jgi:hypothetical protein